MKWTGNKSYWNHSQRSLQTRAAVYCERNFIEPKLAQGRKRERETQRETERERGGERDRESVLANNAHTRNILFRQNNLLTSGCTTRHDFLLFDKLNKRISHSPPPPQPPYPTPSPTNPPPHDLSLPPPPPPPPPVIFFFF